MIQLRLCRKYAGEFSTDGYTVSILFRKPAYPQADEPPTSEAAAVDSSKAQASKPSPGEAPPSHPPPDDNTTSTVWGLDPGSRDLFHAVNNRGEELHMSTLEWREKAKFTASSKTMQGWLKQPPSHLDSYLKQVPSCKSASVQTLDAYILHFLRGVFQALQWHLLKPFRAQRFKRACMARKTLSEVCGKLTQQHGKDTVVGFGDWNNRAPFLRLKGPVLPFRRLLSTRCNVVVVPEFHTSKLHYGCGEELSNMRSHEHRKGDGVYLRSGLVHKVLVCRNRCKVHVHRDKNASLNLLRLVQCQLRGEDRPPEFTRGEG